MSAQPEAAARGSRLRTLTDELHVLEERLRQGGGPDRIERQHGQGKLTARERIALLLDPRTALLEIGLLVAHDRYDGQAPAAGVVTGIGWVHDRPVVIVANDATVKAGSWWPETITKMLRAQEIAMRCRVPIIYLVDSAGVNLPYQGGVFPGQYGASRIFYYNSIMRHYLGVPQLAAVMGPCIAGGAYLPALSDVILMVENTSFMGLGGPNLVKGATGQSVASEELGGAWTHNAISGVAHYLLPDDRACIARIRELVGELPYVSPAGFRLDREAAAGSTGGLNDIVPDNHRQPYDMHELVRALLDNGGLDEFQKDHAPELICGTARLCGLAVGVLANARGLIRDPGGGAPKFGGIIYSDSAEKAAYFIDTMNRHGTPLLFIQDVSGFMVGTDAEHSGIIRAGARFVEAMATATVPKIVLTINHASGAGYYAMAGQGFDPDFIFTWPTGRMGVMEGDSAVMALFGPQLDELKQQRQQPDEALQSKIDAVRADYEEQLDARHAAARGFVDTVIAPEDTRATLAAALWTALHNPGAHLGPFGGVDSSMPQRITRDTTT
ncbi:MAG TPA: carboxyl transferase domain-containing protein [Longimicrobiales bacterium]|nr:carboxyl transferase domain-containing protein [Longimicrobiales bacterium]